MLAILSVGVEALDAEVAAQRVSDQARARRPLTEELNATAVAAEHEAETHPPEHLGNPRTALRACCSLIQVWAGHRLDIEMYRLVFASHQVPPGLVIVSPPPTVRNILSQNMIAVLLL